MTRELVIAAYDRYLDWLDKLSPEIKITVYRKGEEEKQREKWGSNAESLHAKTTSPHQPKHAYPR